MAGPVSARIEVGALPTGKLIAGRQSRYKLYVDNGCFISEGCTDCRGVCAKGGLRVEREGS